MIVGYIMYEFVAINHISKMHVNKNLIAKMDEYNPNDIYSLAYLDNIAFDQNRPSSFEFEIMRLSTNIIIGCMIVYRDVKDMTTHIQNLLQKHRNDSFLGNYIGSGSNGFSYDSSGQLLHNNRIKVGMNHRLQTGYIFAMKYIPHQKIIEFYVNHQLQEYKFTDVLVKKHQKLIAVVGLARYECIKCVSFEVL